MRVRWMPIDGARPTLAYVAMGVAAIVAFVAHVPLWATAVVAAALGAAGVLRTYYRVHVGSDGVRLSRAFARGRFIEYREMSLARREGTKVVLRARNGTKLVMNARTAAIAHAFVEDVNDRIAVVRRPAGVRAPMMLRREGRSVAAWLGAVRPPASDAASYRELALPKETFWEVLEDPTATPTERAAAAFALRKRLDAEGRTRLVRVAEDCAEPKLRVALESIASDDDEDAVMRALDPLADEA